jgi:hypothetical protein
MNSIAIGERYTLITAPISKRGVIVVWHDARVGHRAVAEYQVRTPPLIYIRHFNVAGVAWSNFKPGINVNGNTAIIFTN